MRPLLLSGVLLPLQWLAFTCLAHSERRSRACVWLWCRWNRWDWHLVQFSLALVPPTVLQLWLWSDDSYYQKKQKVKVRPLLALLAAIHITLLATVVTTTPSSTVAAAACATSNSGVVHCLRNAAINIRRRHDALRKRIWMASVGE